LEDLDQLADLVALKELSVRNCDVDFTQLAAVDTLRTLQISNPITTGNLTQIRQLTQLAILDIYPYPEDLNIDLSALGDTQLAVHANRNRHRIVRKGEYIKIRWK
jgi:hypothetical protein